MPGPPSSDYGLDDEDVIDLGDPTMIVDEPSDKVAWGRRTAGGGAPAEQYDARGVQQTTGGATVSISRRAPEIDTSGLQTRVAELEQELRKFQRALEEAKSDALSKAGAISILRSKHDKATKEYERKLSVIQKLHTEQSSKQKAEIEAARKDQETVKINNQFLEHDLAQEVERSKRLKSATNAGTRPTEIATRTDAALSLIHISEPTRPY